MLHPNTIIFQKESKASFIKVKAFKARNSPIEDGALFHSLTASPMKLPLVLFVLGSYAIAPLPHLLYISTSVWVLRTQNAGGNTHFSFTAVF